MKFHPGGVDDLMKSAGKDSTILFDEVYIIICETAYYGSALHGKECVQLCVGSEIVM